MSKLCSYTASPHVSADPCYLAHLPPLHRQACLNWPCACMRVQVWARVTALRDVKASVNWMYAAKMDSEGAAMYDAAIALRQAQHSADTMCGQQFHGLQAFMCSSFGHVGCVPGRRTAGLFPTANHCPSAKGLETKVAAAWVQGGHD